MDFRKITCIEGWLFANGDAKDLPAAANSLYQGTLWQSDDKGRWSKDYVRNTYDVNVTAGTYLREYEKIEAKNAD